MSDNADRHGGRDDEEEEDYDDDGDGTLTRCPTTRTVTGAATTAAPQPPR